MSEEKWFSLGTTDDVEILAKPWVPGDGVTCSSASHQRREPCGPPIAVVETVKYKTAYAGGRYITTDAIDKRVVRVACAEHLAGRIGRRYGNARSEMVARATKRATEEVLTKHWKQYQGFYQAALEDERAQLLDGVPEPFRSLILADEESSAESGAA